MQMLLICINSSLHEIFEKELNERHIEGFTRVDNVAGSGHEGRHEGHSPFYESNALYFVAIADQQRTDEIVEQLSALRKKYPKEGVKVFSTTAEQLL